MIYSLIVLIFSAANPGQLIAASNQAVTKEQCAVRLQEVTKEVLQQLPPNLGGRAFCHELTYKHGDEFIPLTFEQMNLTVGQTY